MFIEKLIAKLSVHKNSWFSASHTTMKEILTLIFELLQGSPMKFMKGSKSFFMYYMVVLAYSSCLFAALLSLHFSSLYFKQLDNRQTPLVSCSPLHSCCNFSFLIHYHYKSGGTTPKKQKIQGVKLLNISQNNIKNPSLHGIFLDFSILKILKIG